MNVVDIRFLEAEPGRLTTATLIDHELTADNVAINRGDLDGQIAEEFQPLTDSIYGDEKIVGMVICRNLIKITHQESSQSAVEARILRGLKTMGLDLKVDPGYMAEQAPHTLKRFDWPLSSYLLDT